MHRAVVLTSLVLLMLAVAGVAAHEGGRFAAGSSVDDPPGSFAPEGTSLPATWAKDPEASAP